MAPKAGAAWDAPKPPPKEGWDAPKEKPLLAGAEEGPEREKPCGDGRRERGAVRAAHTW